MGIVYLMLSSPSPSLRLRCRLRLYLRLQDSPCHNLFDSIVSVRSDKSTSLARRLSIQCHMIRNCSQKKELHNNSLYNWNRSPSPSLFMSVSVSLFKVSPYNCISMLLVNSFYHSLCWHTPQLSGIASVVLKPARMYNLYRTTSWTNYVKESFEKVSEN